MRMRIGVGWPLFTLALLVGCNTQDVAVSKGDPNGTVSTVPQFAPLPAVPKLTILESGERVFGDAATNDSRLVSVLFDNGTDSDVTIEFVAEAKFVVAAKSQAKLFTHVGEVAFRAFDSQSAEPEAIKLTAEPGDSFIYNHRAFWDYTWTRAEYATAQVFSGNDRSIHFAGPIFFKTGQIDFLFQPLPASVQTPTIGGGFATDAKTSLNHSADDDRRRVVRRIENGNGTALHIVSDGNDSVYVHRLGDSIRAGQLTVYVDHAALAKDAAPLTIRISDQQVAEVPADQILRLHLPIAVDSLVADFGGGITESLDVATEQSGNFIWCPNGCRLYEIEYKRYSTSAFGFGTKEQDSVSCRGLRFFRCDLRLIFQPFPGTLSLSANQLEANIGRLVKREVGDFPTALEQSLQQRLAQAKGEMSPNAYSSLAAALPVSKKLSDCDLMLADAWLALEQREFTTTVSLCDEVLVFQPQRALAYKLRGLARATDPSSNAAADLRRAIELDPNLETELRPQVEQLDPQPGNSK